MNFFDIKSNFDFIGQRKVAFILSGLLMVVSIGSIAFQQLNFGIDFTGGTLIEVGYPEAPDLQDVRATIDAEGYDDAVVQTFGTPSEILVRLAPQDDEDRAEISNQVIQALEATAGTDLDVRRVDFVGPQVGEELREQGGIAVVFALIGILIYVLFRFTIKFSLSAIAALVHDVTLTVGVFSLFQLPFDLSVLAAILAVIGYSLNDTIVVFDRIRENFRKMRKASREDVINASINQTLSRTLVTSLTTLLVLFALFFLGGEAINAFALALIVGIVVGTYSSIYVASPISYLLGVSRSDFLIVEKEGDQRGSAGEQV